MMLLSNILSFSWLSRTRNPSSRDSRDEPPDTNQDIISRATSGEEVISALVRRGCVDLTAEINLAACSDLPRAGGGFCDVYKGSLNHGAKIAIKSLRLFGEPGNENERGKMLKRAARELYHWSKLKHPNVLPLMGLAMFRGHLSMISEWMDNGNLMAYLRLNPDIDPVGLCVNICAGLSYIHDNNMVHGDLKGANTMVSQNGVVMIADFGNSQLRDLTLKFTNTTSSSLSIRWAAPELLLGKEDGPQVSKKSDVYAFGMTVLETLTGKVPFEEFNERKVLSLVALKRQTPARPTNGISSEIWKILKCCWRWEHSARPDIGIIEKLLRNVYFQAWVKARRQDNFTTSHLKTNESAMPETEHERTSGSDDSIGEYRKGLRGLSGLAKEYLTQCQLDKAEVLAVEVLTAQKRMLGAEHPDTLQTMHNLALTYYNQGRLEKAEWLNAEVLVSQKRALRAHHPDTLRTMHNLAVTYRNQGRLVEAESLNAEVLAARKQVLGMEHPDTLQTMHNLAVTYRNQDRLAEAESLDTEVLAARKRVLGADHPNTLQTMHNLAATYCNQGRLTEAESLNAAVLAAQKRTLKADHPDTLRTMHNLVVMYYSQGRLPEAESLSAEVLAARKRVLGVNHPDTLRTMHNLALSHDKQGRLVEAESLFVEVLAARKRVLGADHPETLRTMHSLTVTYDKQGRIAEAESLYAEAQDTREAIARSRSSRMIAEPAEPSSFK